MVLTKGLPRLVFRHAIADERSDRAARPRAQACTCKRRDDRAGDEQAPSGSDRPHGRESRDERPEKAPADGAGRRALRGLRILLQLELRSEGLGHQDADLGLGEPRGFQIVDRTNRVAALGEDPGHHVALLPGAHCVVSS
jgi:hypothetical protein